MVRLKHLIPASLTLSAAIAPSAAASSSAVVGDSLADDMARPHPSVRRARGIVQAGGADVPVPRSRL